MSVAETKFEPATVNVRTKISALWTSMLFVFAYVDLFSLYRPDFRADLEAAEVGGFTVNQPFLLGTAAYVVIPSLMVFFTLVLQPRLNRFANIALGIVYIVTIVVGAVGELGLLHPRQRGRGRHPRGRRLLRMDLAKADTPRRPTRMSALRRPIYPRGTRITTLVHAAQPPTLVDQFHSD
jgi:hypothetical protein